MASTFQRSLTFTNCVKEDIKHLAFVPSSRYLISATDNQVTPSYCFPFSVY